jgi:hypothetical protein
MCRELVEGLRKAPLQGRSSTPAKALGPTWACVILKAIARQIAVATRDQRELFLAAIP